MAKQLPPISYNSLTNKPNPSATSAGDVLARVNLVAIGDSRTFLNHATSVVPSVYRFNNGVINQIMSLTGDRHVWQKSFNLGISGDTAQGIDQRKTSVATVMATRPGDEWDLIYWVDINDAIANISSTSFLGYFKSSMKYFMDIGVRHIFVISGLPYPSGYNGETTSQHTARLALIKAYNAGMLDFCSSQKNLHYVDAYTAVGGGTDTLTIPNTDIHPGFGSAQQIAQAAAPVFIAARGKRTVPGGVSLVKNPTLYSASDTAAPDAYYEASRTNVTLNRNKANGALTVALDGTSTNAAYQIFCNAEAYNDTLMPGDIIQGFLDVQVTAASGPNAGIELKVQTLNADTSNYGTIYANANTGGYAKYGIASDRQLYATDPFTIPSGKAGMTAVPYLNMYAQNVSGFTADLYEASVRRTFASPNAEYSASRTIPNHRRNIRCLTATATGALTFTLPQLGTVDDGELRTFTDTQGNAATNAVTIKGGQQYGSAAAWAASTAYAGGAAVLANGNYYYTANGGTSASSGTGPSGTGSSTDNTVTWAYVAPDMILDGGVPANTVVKSTNYFTATYRADKGAAAWVRQ